MKKLAAAVLLLALAACGRGRGHSGKSGAGSRLGGAAVMPVFAPEARIDLARGKDPQELVRIGTRGLVIGPAGGPLVWKLFVDPRRADEAWYFLQTYAPFHLATPMGELTFRGRGSVKAGLAERRMIVEWARRVAIEAAGGRAGAAYGLLLSWHQVGALGECEDLSLYLSGEAVAAACGWDRAIQGRLEPGQLGRIFGWFDRLRPFQAVVGEGSLQPGGQQARLVFAGHGAQSPAPAEQREIEAFAAALFAELAGAAAEPASAPGAPPRQRYLLSPEALHPRPQSVVLHLPDRPPWVPGVARPAPTIEETPETPGPHLPDPPLPRGEGGERQGIPAVFSPLPWGEG